MGRIISFTLAWGLLHACLDIEDDKCNGLVGLEAVLSFLSVLTIVFVFLCPFYFMMCSNVGSGCEYIGLNHKIKEYRSLIKPAMKMDERRTKSGNCGPFTFSFK